MPFHVPKAPLLSPAARNLKSDLLCSASISHGSASVCSLEVERERGRQTVRLYLSLPTLLGLSTKALPSREVGVPSSDFRPLRTLLLRAGK